VLLDPIFCLCLGFRLPLHVSFEWHDVVDHMRSASVNATRASRRVNASLQRNAPSRKGAPLESRGKPAATSRTADTLAARQ
jgi:hypothetical protein